MRRRSRCARGMRGEREALGRIRRCGGRRPGHWRGWRFRRGWRRSSGQRRPVVWWRRGRSRRKRRGRHRWWRRDQRQRRVECEWRQRRFECKRGQQRVGWQRRLQRERRWRRHGRARSQPKRSQPQRPAVHDAWLRHGLSQPAGLPHFRTEPRYVRELHPVRQLGCILRQQRAVRHPVPVLPRQVHQHLPPWHQLLRPAARLLERGARNARRVQAVKLGLGDRRFR